MNKIRIAIVGVGNCASSLLQGINFYGGSSGNGADVGLMHRRIGPYEPQDIEVVAAFDIDLGNPTRGFHRHKADMFTLH